jgi:hypothetical protein
MLPNSTLMGAHMMRRISMPTRHELIRALYVRYGASDRQQKSLILDEFVAISGPHRKHAMRLLRDGSAKALKRQRPRIYEDAAQQALILLWEASDRICGKRLKALIPMLIDSMERHGHLHLASQVRAQLLNMAFPTTPTHERQAYCSSRSLKNLVD